MSNLIGVTTSEIEVQDTGYGDALLAPGLHPAVVTHIEEGETQNGNAYVDYHFTINGGVNQGATIRSREWPQSTNETSRAIYNKKLKTLYTICNVGTLQRIDELYGIQMLIHNKPRQRKDDPSVMENSINYYRSYDPAATLAKEVPAAAKQTAIPAVTAAPQAIPQPTPQAVPAPAGVPAPAPAPVPQQQPVQQPPVAPVQATPQVTQQVAPQVAPQVVQGVPVAQVAVPQAIPQPVAQPVQQVQPVQVVQPPPQADYNDPIPQ